MQRVRPWRLILSALIVLLLSGIGIGCDDRSSAPPIPIRQGDADEPTAIDPLTGRPVSNATRPTTQDLLNGPRRSITLGTLPLSVSAPASWKVDAIAGGGVVFLHGPTPSGDVQIQLSHRPFIKKDQFDSIVTGAQKEKAEKPDTVIKADLRPMPSNSDARIFERQTIGRTMPGVPLDPEGKHKSRPERFFGWTITVYVPEAGGYEAYELNFVGLTAEQYETDRKLLVQVIDSLQYQQAGPATAP